MYMTVSSGVSSASETPPTPELDISFKFASKTLQDYEVISVIGNGTFGTCFKVRDKETGELYAWKGIDYDEFSESKKASLISEIRVLRQLQHPNIVQYYHHLVNHDAKSVYIVMECCEGGDLAQLIKRARNEHKRFEERYIWRLFFQVCKALQVCHNNIKKGTILHRDIKPANIFLDMHGNAKLGDFGLARILRKNQDFTTTFVGTPYYMSPEIVKGSQYNRKSDVWAVGCLTYEMCALRTPFQAAKFEELTLNISKGKFNHVPAVYSDDLQKTIELMLSVDTEQRPSIEVIVRHPTVVRNIIELGNDFPELIEVELNFFDDDKKSTSSKLDYIPVIRLDFTSTMNTEYNSFNEAYGQRRWSDCFTPDLRTELFPSDAMLNRSDSCLYESIKCEDSKKAQRELLMRPLLPLPKPSSLKPSTSDTSLSELKSPSLISEDVFNEALKERLKAIRAQESLLRHREKGLDQRAHELNIREKRLQELEDAFYDREMLLAAKEKAFAAEFLKETQEKMLVSEVQKTTIPCLPTLPPKPPRRPNVNKEEDDTYCCIEDTQLESPTIAKLTLPIANSLRHCKRRVTFKSPQKLTTYEIENIPSASVHVEKKEVSRVKAKQPLKQLQSSTLNHNRRLSIRSDKLNNSTTLNTIKPIKSTETTEQSRHRSIFSSIFNRNNKGTASKTDDVSNQTKNNKIKNKNKPTPVEDNNIQPSPPNSPTKKRITLCDVTAKSVVVDDKPDPSSVWTKEYKRAAFGLLAVMNAGGTKPKIDSMSTSIPNNETLIGRSKLRLSARERRSTTLCRQNNMRRSLMLPSSQNAASLGKDASMSTSICGTTNHTRAKMLV